MNQVPGPLQGMHGVGKVKVSLATSVVSLEDIAEDFMDAAFVQVSQHEAALLLMSGWVHAVEQASGALSVYKCMSDRPMTEGSEPWPMPVHQGSCRALSLAAFVLVQGGVQQCWRSNEQGCTSLGHEVEERGGSGTCRAQWDAALVQGSLQRCCCSDALMLNAHTDVRHRVVLSMCNGLRYRVLQIWHYVCAAACVTEHLEGCRTCECHTPGVSCRILNDLDSAGVGVKVPGLVPGSDSADKLLQCVALARHTWVRMAVSEGMLGLLTVWGRESFLYGWLPVSSITT